MKLKKEIIIKNILRGLAKKILQKYQPRVVGITGSVGKSTAKEMIFTVLKGADFDVRKSEKNYNNEIGIPLTIIGAPGESKNLLQWFGVVCRAISFIAFSRKYPEILVLELAVDHPGDMKYFCDFIPVEVGVLTNVGISHLENFGTEEAILKEKSYLLRNAKKAIIYNEDSLKDKLKNIVANQTVTYGFKSGDFKVAEIGYNYKQENVLAGMIFKVSHNDERLAGKLNNLSGRPYLYGVLAGLGVAKYFKINLEEALQFLENSPVIPGHMSLLAGIKNTSLIDDTYNSAPASVKEALIATDEIEASRKIVVLGDMLELGDREKLSHELVGEKISKMEKVIFVAVGERMKEAVKRFKDKLPNHQDKVYWLEDSVEAGRFVQDLMKEGDLVLLKGSQGMRVERAVVEIMAEPNRKEELVVRQNKDWIN